MKICFFASDKPHEQLLADAFIRGLKRHGDTGEVRRLDGTAQVATGCEVAVMVGIKSREMYQANIAAGVHVVMMDKGYLRHRIKSPVRRCEYWRVAVDKHHPTRTLMRKAMPPDRARGIVLKPWRWRGGHILIAGSSGKYHEFCGLCGPTEYATRLVKRIAEITSRRIIYRPKPSWSESVPIKGAGFSTEKSINAVLSGCHVLVTHGSNACFEAVLAGVPCIILGDGVAKPISSTDIRRVKKPYLATGGERRQWLANLMYCQFTLHEFESGLAWAVIRPQIYGESR